jgi:hypothetical protein
MRFSPSISVNQASRARSVVFMLLVQCCLSPLEYIGFCTARVRVPLSGKGNCVEVEGQVCLGSFHGVITCECLVFVLLVPVLFTYCSWRCANAASSIVSRRFGYRLSSSY